MSFLLFDCGNTRTKWATGGATEGESRGESRGESIGREQGGDQMGVGEMSEGSCPTQEVESELHKWLEGQSAKEGSGAQNITAAIILSSGNSSDTIARILHQHCIPKVFQLREVADLPANLPLKIAYKSPQTLGLDRYVAALASEAQFPHQPKLIIDFGTAITIDHTDAEGRYLGGNISAGLGLRLAALHQHTALLPLIDSKKISELNPSQLTAQHFGTTTTEALTLGAIRGICNEIEGYIQQNPNKIVYFAGGDAKYFEKLINFPIFVNSQATFTGLSIILEKLCQAD